MFINPKIIVYVDGFPNEEKQNEMKLSFAAPKYPVYNLVGNLGANSLQPVVKDGIPAFFKKIICNQLYLW